MTLEVKLFQTGLKWCSTFEYKEIIIVEFYFFLIMTDKIKYTVIS